MKTISFAKCPEGRGREVNIASNKTFRGHYLRLQGNPLGGRGLKFWKLGYHYPPLLSYIVSSPQPLIFKIIKIILHLQKKNQSICISFAHWHVYTFIIFLLCLLHAFWSPSQVCSFVKEFGVRTVESFFSSGKSRAFLCVLNCSFQLSSLVFFF